MFLSPPARRQANQPCIGQMRWHRSIKKRWGPGVKPPKRRAAPQALRILRNIRQIKEPVPLVGDVLLPPLEVVPQQQLEHLGGGLRVLGHDLDQPPRLRVHGGQPHHVRVVLAQALAPVDLVFLPLQALDDLPLLPLGVGEPGLLPAGDLKEGGLGDIHVPLLDQGGAQAVEHGEDQCADLEAVHVGVGADDHLAPAEVVEVEGAQVLHVLVLDLHPAAQDLDEPPSGS